MLAGSDRQAAIMRQCFQLMYSVTALSDAFRPVMNGHFYVLFWGKRQQPLIFLLWKYNSQRMIHGVSGAPVPSIGGHDGEGKV